jgi:hypothetical protein
MRPPEGRNRLQFAIAYRDVIDHSSTISPVEARDLLNLLYRVDEASAQREGGARRHGHLAPDHL